MRRWAAGRAPVGLPVLAAAVGLAMSLVPTLLPRPVLVQGIFSAVVLLQSYAIGTLVRSVVRAGSAGRRPAWWSQVRTWRVQVPLAVTAFGVVAAGVLAGSARTGALLQRMGEAPLPLTSTLLAALLATGIGVAVLVLVRGVRALAGVVLRSRRARVALLAPALALATTVAALPTALPAQAAGTSAVSDPSTWGGKGRQFLHGTPTAAQVSRVTGRPAARPLRVYAGLDVATSPERRADLAVEELAREGGLRRAAVVVVVPTGSGWVDPAAVASAEYLYGGDVATLAVQYARTPSWVAYLRGTEGARETAAATLESLQRRVTALPSSERPQVLVFGESLGALAGLMSQPDVDALRRRTDGGLWVGVPAQARDRARQLADDPRQAVLVHADDPVAAWSPRLAVERTPEWHRTWMPVVTFWQAGADLVSAYWTPDGFGHRYSRELVDGWRQAAQPDEPGTPTSRRVPAVRDAVGALASVG
ncbi:hypothetical protein GCM10027446_18140 [Angustibacter peucedani]